MEKHLLLPTSTLSQNSSLIDEIHQSIIELQCDHPEEEIQNLLRDSLSFLDEDSDIKTTEEIIYLIFECLSHIKNQKKEIFMEIIANSKNSSNRLILFGQICAQNEKEINYPQTKTLISDISKQILKYIKSNERKLIIFNHEIGHEFKNSFIYNIIFRVKTSERVVSAFYSYILTQINISKEKSDKLFQKVINANLITSLSEDVLADERYFGKFSKDDIISMLPKITAKTFPQILTLIEKYIPDKNSLNFFIPIFEKCVELDVDFKYIQNPIVFELLDPKSMKSSYWTYFYKNEISLPDEFLQRIEMFPEPKEALLLIKNYEKIPVDVLAQGLMEINDTFIYDRLFDYDFDGKESSLIQDKNFWIHIFNVFSSSKEKYIKPLYEPFVKMFEQFVDIEKSYEYIEAMIFAKFPTTETGNQFLIDFLNNLNSDYKEAFNQNKVILLTLISDMKSFPLPSFWSIIGYEFIDEYFANEVEINDPVMSYAFYFSNCKSHLKTIEYFLIQPFTDEVSVIEFIKKNDLNYMTNMNNDSIFLIIAALIYTEQEIKPEIYGLTKMTILPFLAVSFNLLSNKNSNYLPLSNEMLNLLINACKFLVLADKPLLNESINSILTHFDCLFQHYNETALEMIEIFVDQLIDDAYTANETILLRTIFEMQKYYSSNDKVQFFFEKFGISLINRVLKIEDILQLQNIKFDLKIFNIKKVTSILIKSIQSSNFYNEVINAINIIINSNIEVQDIEKQMKKIDLNKIAHKAIVRNKINDIILLSDFISRYNQPKLNLNQYFNMCTLNWQNCSFEFFFDLLISTNTNYFEILFEKICVDFEVQPKTILEKYYTEYNKHGDDFIKVLLSNFIYNSKDKKFIKLPKDSKNNFFFISSFFKEAESKLNDYETFSMLHKFISTFPFIFNEINITNIFNAILPALDNFNLYFTIDNNSDDMSVNQLKRSISAFYCLYSSLYSPKILDSFFTWLFKNFEYFSPSQTFSILIILISLFSTEKVRDGMLAFSEKLGFTKILYQFNKTKMPNEISLYYKENVFQLTMAYFNEIFESKDSRNAYIQGLGNNKYPFSSIFDKFHTIYPTKLSPLNLPRVKNDIIKKYIENFNEPQTFSVHYERPSIEITEEQVEEFILHCNKLKKTNENEFSSKSYLIDRPSLEEIKYCSLHCDNWIYRSFFDTKFHLTKSSAHIKILDKVKSDIRNIGYSYDDSLYSCFKSDFTNYQFIYSMINDTKYSPIVNKIIKSKKGVNLFSESIKRYGGFHSENYINIKNYFVSIINDYNIDSSLEFKEALIVFSMSPEMRKDFEFLILASKEIGKSYSHISHSPKKIDFLLSFMLSSNNTSVNESAFELIENIGHIEILPSLEKSIKRFFDIELSKRKPSAFKIISYVKMVPSLLKSCTDKIPLMIDTYMAYYKPNLNNKKSIIKAIYTLFNEISPERKEDEFIYNPNDENAMIDFSLSSSAVNVKVGGKKDGLLQKVPNHLIQSNPTFWNLYIKHIKKLNEIVSEDTEYFSKFKFLKDYPELMSFENRVNLFRKSIPRIRDFYSSTSLHVHRSRVLTDSFNELRGKSRGDWLSLFNVHFTNENGIDAGGLTKDWFSLIAKEIFNPNFALFVLTENQTYQPNPFSAINPQHIEYFNFIGKVIARAIIQGQYVKCHFARSFIRQILQLPLKLKDFEDYDANVYNSMLLILNEDVEPLCLTFTIDVDEFGATKTVLLKENGDEIDVTNENKKEYVSLYANYRLRKSIIKQINAFCEGFYSLIPYKDIKLFSPSELDLMICGIPDIDVEDLRANTRFNNPYHDHHPVIEMFFSAISKWNRDDLAKFLLFVTGSSQVPINGFKEYCDKGKPFTISPGGDKERFCVAHTCFNTLDLPYYESEEDLNRKLLVSIQELEFGIA